MHEISIVVPFYNEERNVSGCVSGLRDALRGTDYELVLVNNGSSDGTQKEIDSLAGGDGRLRKVWVRENVGYGNGIVRGLEASDGGMVGWVDGDCQNDYSSLAAMYRRLVSGSADVLVASRSRDGDSVIRLFLSRGYNAGMRLLFGLGIPDVNGKPKLFKRAVIGKIALRSRDWFVDTELLLKARRNGFTVSAYPVKSLPRRYGKSNVRLTVMFEFAANLLKYRFGLYG